MNLSPNLLEQLRSMPIEIQKAIETTLWQGPPQIAQLKKMGAALRDLWPQLARDRGAGSSYSAQATFAQAYAAYYLPANVMKIPAVLAEMQSMGVGIKQSGSDPLRWVDLGCGPGTAVFGAAWYLKKFTEVNAQFWGFDHSREFRSLAQKMTQTLGSQQSLGLRAQWQAFDFKTSKREDFFVINPHVVSASNSLSEFGDSAEERAQWVWQLVSWLEEMARRDGRTRWLILLEPGSKASSRDLLVLRKFLIEQSQGQGLRLLLPCLSERPCGALESPGDWCHEELEFEPCSWQKQLGAEAELKKEQMLFSYLVWAIGPHSENVAPSTWPSNGERVVSQRLKEKGLTKCYLCTPLGKKLRRVLDSRVTEQNEGFLSATRGQIFDSLVTDEKGSVITVSATRESDHQP